MCGQLYIHAYKGFSPKTFWEKRTLKAGFDFSYNSQSHATRGLSNLTGALCNQGALCNCTLRPTLKPGLSTLTTRWYHTECSTIMQVWSIVILNVRAIWTLICFNHHFSFQRPRRYKVFKKSNLYYCPPAEHINLLVCVWPLHCVYQCPMGREIV